MLAAASSTVTLTPARASTAAQTSPFGPEPDDDRVAHSNHRRGGRALTGPC